MTEGLQIDDTGRVRVCTFDRQDKKNAITQAMYQALADAITSYGSDDSLRALVITGAGDMFTAGNDLQDFAMGSRDVHDLPPVAQFLNAIATCEKPLIAAVNGPAIGVGLTLLLHCDLAFASTRATFGAPFVKLSLVPEASSSLLLPATVGMAVANDILMADRTLTADEALRFGLVSRVFEPESLMADVMAIAEKVAAMSPRSMQRSKNLIRHNRDQVVAHMTLESKQFAEQLQHPDFMESVAALMQKRSANFG